MIFDAVCYLTPLELFEVQVARGHIQQTVEKVLIESISLPTFVMLHHKFRM